VFYPSVITSDDKETIFVQGGTLLLMQEGSENAATEADSYISLLAYHITSLAKKI
jgi:hypothetical protein